MKAPTTRDVALAVVRDVFGRQLRTAQAAFDYRVRRAGLSPRDRAFTAELAYGSIKMRRTLDWYLRPYIGVRSTPLPTPIHEALRLGVYQLRFMHGVDQHAAVFETVGAALRVGHRGTAGLVNAVLRKFIADDLPPPAPEDFETEDAFLATRYSVPDWIAAQWRARFEERAPAVLAGIGAAPQLGIRVNALLASSDEVITVLGERGVRMRRSELACDALVALARPDGPLEDAADGTWTLQSEASCLPVDLLDPQPGERVVDLCSGRGNKAVQLAARMRNAGSLTCIEYDERKVHSLRETLARATVAIAHVACEDARTAPQNGAVADAVLVDAPCSAIGVLGRHPEARWRKTSQDGHRLAADQALLLASAAARLRPGGRLAYAVCSTDARECEDVVDAFLAAVPEVAREGLPERYAAVATPAGDVLVPPGIDGRDGFYVALLRRRQSS